MDIRIVKIRRCFRKSPRVALARFVEPVFNAGQILTFIASVIGLALLLHLGMGPQARDKLAEQWAIAIEAFLLALIGWAAISCAIAPILVIRGDRRKGHWDGHHYIYNEPLLVATARFTDVGPHTQQRAIKFNDAEPGAFVYYELRLTPDPPNRVLAVLGGGTPNPNRQLVEPGTVRWGLSNNGTRLPQDRSATLCLRMLPATVPVICRVYCQSFFVGKDDGSP